jgi:(E)-4-hydroxy-3-methylbut-2-enyl-diphosphate synthase
MGIGFLLFSGIGETLRVSLTADPVEEVRVGWEILKSLGLRSRGPMLVSCPSCGRCEVDLIDLATRVEKAIAGVKKPLHIAVMGCVVNGPGESKHASIGISLPGTGEAPVAPVYVDGERVVTLRGDNIAAEFRAIVDDYVAKKYPERQNN